MNPLSPAPVARLLGSLLLLQGTTIVFFWKILDYALAVGLARYSSASGRLARAFFNTDRELAGLLQLGQQWLPLLLVLGIGAMLGGILSIAFPVQTAQILRAFRILRATND